MFRNVFCKDAVAHAVTVKAVESIDRSLSHPYTGLEGKSIDEYQGKGFMYDLVKNEGSSA